MSNLYERPLALVPQPQQIQLTTGAWQPPRRWKFFDAPRGRAWAFAGDARAARRLLARAPRLREKKPEAYALTTFPDGAVAVASDSHGLLHSRTTLQQLLAIAGDSPLPLVEIQDWPDLAVRGIHLDLKYMMHRKDYLLRWLDSLAGYKINTLLLEYEDKFPYRKHRALRHPAAFTESELDRFLSHARSLGLRVVPLIQTLGHVEYILKHRQFAHLRQGEFQTEYDTRKPAVWPFIREMLDEVLEWHGPDDWFHVGGDECWKLSQQPPAVKTRIYGEHMGKALRHLIGRGKRPMMWEDMIRGLPDKEFTALCRHLPRQTILCYWSYNSTPPRPERGAALKPEVLTLNPHIFEQPKRWVEYRKAGYDVLGVPCHDWGPIVPFYDRYTVPNTVTLIRDAVRHDCPGIINSHWACFHSPLPLQDYGIALTGDRAWKLERHPSARDFDESYCRLRLGVSDRLFVEALYQMGGMLEMPTRKQFGRPVHLPYWYYMDSILHYTHAQADRIRYGPCIPAERADFKRMVSKKLALLAESPVREASLRGLERFRDQNTSARSLLRLVQPRRGRELVQLVAWLADFRGHAAERMLFLAGASRKPGRQALMRRLQILRKGMRRVYGRFLHPRDYPAEEASLFAGEEALLKAKR